MRTGPLVDLERVRLAAGAVQRCHQLSGEVLAGGLLGQKGLELGNQVGVAAKVELGIDSGLERDQSEFLEAANFGLGEVFERDVRERRATPPSQRVGQKLAGTNRITFREGVPAVTHPLGERVGVKVARLDGQHVAAAHRPQTRAILRVDWRQGLAKPEHAHLQALGRPVALGAPDRVDHGIGR